MPKQWVDITTIDNVTPFTKVRWKSHFYGSQFDAWFSEMSGLTTDNMYWTGGNAANGWYSAHRMNNGYNGQYVYCCSFNHSGSSYWDVSGIEYRVSVNSAARSQYYDTAVTINGETYYEVDFGLWENAVPLYAPYSRMKWTAGDIYVEIGTNAIILDKSAIKFDSTGGSDTIVITADDDWTAVVSDSWITASTISGQSGTTTITVSTSDYQDTTTNRSGTIVFTCSGDSETLSILQRRKPVASVIVNLSLGDTTPNTIYLGDDTVEAMWLGDNLIFPGLITDSILMGVSANTYPHPLTASTSWEITSMPEWVTISPTSGTNGTSVINIVSTDNTGTTRNGEVIFTLGNGLAVPISIIQYGKQSRSLGRQVGPGETIKAGREYVLAASDGVTRRYYRHGYTPSSLGDATILMSTVDVPPGIPNDCTLIATDLGASFGLTVGSSSYTSGMRQVVFSNNKTRFSTYISSEFDWGVSNKDYYVGTLTWGLFWFWGWSGTPDCGFDSYVRTSEEKSPFILYEVNY